MASSTLSAEQQLMNQSILTAMAHHAALERAMDRESLHDSSGSEREEGEEDEEEIGDALEGSSASPVAALPIEPRLFHNIMDQDGKRSDGGEKEMQEEEEEDSESFDALCDEVESIGFIGAWYDRGPDRVGRPGPAFCVLPRLHRLRPSGSQLQSLLSSPAASARCVALIYIRLALYRAADVVCRSFEPLLRDDAAVALDIRGKEVVPVREVALKLLTQQRSLFTVFPRFPAATSRIITPWLAAIVPDAVQAASGPRHPLKRRPRSPSPPPKPQRRPGAWNERMGRGEGNGVWDWSLLLKRSRAWPLQHRRRRALAY
eukprot:NODE_951_length_1801_cov_33.010274_g838_i0.p1 GENE.NODE_951_length_1801_cov_33.010274_g838_i0~~NODE_951_length_1801_cov_33.010274_g838_i0.p1  ORF type:complete len:317 (-),score=47.10 NODE_951_length_1801_cov_33.010274_g838_i0:692-1642(-)